jgi:hypothetical protein
MWSFFEREEPDYKNFAAFDFVITELNARVRSDGVRNAAVERGVLVERAVAAGLPRNDTELAVTYLALMEQLTEKDGILRFKHANGVHQLPSETLEQLNRTHSAPRRKDARVRADPIVRDIIERRADGRPQSVEPLDAFAEQLDRLKHGRFRLWWKQTVAELRCSDVQYSPVSVSVLAAALVEGSLTFVVNHARQLGLGVFRSPDFDRDPRTWKIDDLVTSAASGSDTAILDLQTKTRAEMLIRNRQRIHAGRMLSEFPTGVPDIRPEEARDAKATADQVVRRVLDWLQRFPPA